MLQNHGSYRWEGPQETQSSEMEVYNHPHVPFTEKRHKSREHQVTFPASQSGNIGLRSPISPLFFLKIMFIQTLLF